MQVKFFKNTYVIENSDDISVVEVTTPKQVKHTFYFKEICGLRLQSYINDLDLEFDYRRLSVVREVKKFDLLQIITLPEISIKGFFKTNQMYENKDFHRTTQQSSHVTRKFTLKKDSLELNRLGFAELITRFESPGSTVFYKDNLSAVINDQIGLEALSVTTNTGSAYILSFDLSDKAKMVSFFWNSSKHVGLGGELLRDQLLIDHTKSFVYFVSILNVSAIKTLLRNGFILKHEIWNYSF